MELLRGLDGLRSQQRPCVATIGAFDGIHLGHQAVIGQLAEQGRQDDLDTVVITFEPLPREYLAKQRAPARLQSFREKCEALEALGVDQLLCLRFNESLRQMSAESFAREIFVDGLCTRVLVLGDDFRFGREREGDAAFMAELGNREGFRTMATTTVAVDGQRVSSTRLRAALAAGDFGLAARLLGREYAISGRVIHGRKLARKMGSPTANICLRRRSIPVHGVYMVSVDGEDLHSAPAIANVGMRPTIADALRPNLEVHILEGRHDLYGKRISVRFHQKLRDEQRFRSLSALKAGIQQDIEQARGWFAARGEDAHNA